MSDLTKLPEITFAEKDTESIIAGLIARYEDASGKTLYPGDPVRLFLDTIAYELALQRSIIDYTGKMNLLAYAAGGYLDHIGAMLGVTRLAPTAASCTVRFTLSEIRTDAVIIPAGLRVTDGYGVYFAVRDDTVIAAGSLYADTVCVCTEAGTAGNGIAAGRVKTLVDPAAYIASVANINAADGGADEESDDNLRERIRLAPESFSVAGPYGAYRFWARSAHQSISDVSVMGPEMSTVNYVVKPGEVHVFPLCSDGNLPSDAVLAAVEETLNGEKIRPLSDTVVVRSPTQQEYSLNLTYYIDRDDAASAAGIKSAVESAVSSWIDWQKVKLGRDINPSALISRIVGAGAKRVSVRSPVFTALAPNCSAVCVSRTVVFGGFEDG